MEREASSKFDCLRNKLSIAERNLVAASDVERFRILKELSKLREKIGELVRTNETGYGNTELEFEKHLEVLVTCGYTIVAPVYVTDGALLLLAYETSNGFKAEAIEIPGENLEKLYATLDDWLGCYKIEEQQYDSVNEIGKQLWEQFAGQLIREMDNRGVKKGSKLTILPDGVQGILPIGLALDPKTGERLFESYELNLAPSIFSVL